MFLAGFYSIFHPLTFIAPNILKRVLQALMFGLCLVCSAVDAVEETSSVNTEIEEPVVVKPAKSGEHPDRPLQKEFSDTGSKETEGMEEATSQLVDSSEVSSDNEQVLPESEGGVSGTLPHDLSPWGMFLAADWVVKVVMVGLVIASLLTWTVLLAKSIELGLLRRRLTLSLIHLNEVKTLTGAAETQGITDAGRTFIRAAETELVLSIDLTHQDGGKDGVKERLVSSLSRIEVAVTRDLMVGTGLLATVGAVAPFVGLFGTVWGIMNSFIGISEANTTNLAVVAPGIAEALLATALGLVAAIPAVVIYNHFTRKIAGIRALVSDSAAAVMRLVSRDLDRNANRQSTPLKMGA